jgi:hypothetical protein
MALTHSLNGTDLATHKIYVSGNSETWHSSPKFARAAASSPGRLRRYFAALDAASARPFVFPFGINAFNVTDRQTEADWIKGFLRQSVTYQYSDGVTTRQLVGIMTDVSLTPVGGQANATVLRGTFTIDPEEPLWRATSDTVLGPLGNSDTPIVLGNAPCEDWVLAITVSGGSDPRTFTITIKNGGGTTLHTLTWTGSLSSNTLTISALAQSVKNNVTDAIATFSGGFPVLDPKDSPTIRVVASSGTATGSLTHRKRYY